MTAARADVAVFVPSLRGGGAERVMVNLCGGLAAAGVSTHLITAEAGGALSRAVPPGVELVELGSRRTATSLSGLTRHLRRSRPRAVLGAMAHANLVAALASKLAGLDARIVLTEHVAMSPFLRHAPLKYRVVASLRRWGYQMADEIVAVAEGTRTDLIERAGIPGERVRVIPNAVLDPRFDARAAEAVEHRWLVPGEPPLILAVGRLKKQKNFLLLIEAFARLRRRRSAHLLILGEGEERARLEAAVRLHGLDRDVEMPGFVSNPPAFMARASLLALSSSWEGLPTVVVEALAVGCPVVATDCPSGPREILGSGRWGRLVPMDDAEAFARAMQETLEAEILRDELRARARTYRTESVVAQYRDCLGV